MDPEQALRRIVFHQQCRHVRGCWRLLAGQCFTGSDLEEFTRDARRMTIADGLRREKLFVETASRVKAMKRQTTGHLINARPASRWPDLGAAWRR